MSAPLLSYRHIFGLKADVRGNVHYLDDQTVLYPAGHNVIVYSAESKTQRFIHGTDFSQAQGRAEICALAVSPNKRFVAISERGAERGQISIYDIGSLKKRKTLATGECLSREYVSLCFSPNGENLLSLGGAPDYALVNWEWKKSRHTQLTKVECKNQPLTQCSYCPSDQKMLCVTGLNTLQYFKIESGPALKPLETTLYAEPLEDYTCHAWTTQKKMIVGTAKGRLLFLENTLLRAPLKTAPNNDRRIDAIEAATKGFVVGCDDGTVRVYERHEKEFYVCARVYNVEGAPRIRSLSISPSDEHLCVSTDTSQLYVMRGFDADVPLVDSSQKFELLHVKNHAGAITGLDVCTRKPIVVTCGEDRTVRIWNYITKTVELSKTFADVPCSVALHPSGLHVVVGFADRLKFMNLLMDDIRPVKELPVKDCREVRFANGGHLFACAQSGQILLFNTYTCELVTPPFKQHSGRVRSLYFSLDDSLLISSGDDGSVYGKKLHQLTKSHNYSEKAIKFPAALCGEDGMIYAAGDDRILKLIHGKNVIKIVNCEVVLTALAISRNARDQKLLFSGTQTGVVRSFKFPITGEIKDYTCHSRPVTRIRLSEDDAFLFSVADDGCLAMFDVKDAAGGRLAKRDRPDVTGYSEEVLVTKSDLEEKNSKMMELRTNLEELSKRYEMQVKLNDLNQTDKLKALHDKYHLQLNHNKSRVDMLKDEKAAQKLDFEQKRKALQQWHMQTLAAKDMEYTTQVINEHQKGTKLDDEIKLSQQHFEMQKEQREKKHKLDLAAVTESYVQDVDLLKDRCAAIERECERLDRQLAEVKAQIEEDADAEIEAFKAKNEERLLEQKQITLGLKGENTHMKKKFAALEKNIIDQNENLRAFKDKEVELAEKKKELDDLIDSHKQEIDERDNRIGKHETDIYDLKKENQELEKYKFVLDYQIKHYKTQIEPKDKAIQKMKEKVAEMDKKLSKEHKKNGELNDLKKQLEQSLKLKQKEIRAQRQRARWRSLELNALANDLHEVVPHIQDPLVLRARTIELYRKHVTEQIQAAEVDPDVAKEYKRQRQFLEKSVDALKRKLTRDMKARKNENMRIMQENVALIKEINALRKEIKNMRQVQRHKDLHSMEYGAAGAAAAAADAPFDEREAQRIIERQREQIASLRAQIEDAHSRLVQVRPYSRERLPPIGDEAVAAGAAGPVPAPPAAAGAGAGR